MKRLTVLCAVGLLAAGGAFAAPAAEEAMSMEPTVLTVVLSDRGTAPINVDSAVIDAVEEKLNIRFDLTAIAGGDYNAKKRTLIATDDVPDILRVHRNDLNEFGDTGVFLALNDMIDTMVPNYKRILEGNERVQKTAIDGVYYAFATTKHFEFHRGIISVIRTDVVEDLGLEHAAELRRALRGAVRHQGGVSREPHVDHPRRRAQPGAQRLLRLRHRRRRVLRPRPGRRALGVRPDPGAVPRPAGVPAQRLRRRHPRPRLRHPDHHAVAGEAGGRQELLLLRQPHLRQARQRRHRAGQSGRLVGADRGAGQRHRQPPLAVLRGRGVEPDVGRRPEDGEPGRGRRLLQLRLHPGVRRDEGVRARGRALGARRRRLSSSRTRCGPSTPARPAPT